jgi:tetratricopeptide (TPR) repeat protein
MVTLSAPDIDRETSRFLLAGLLTACSLFGVTALPTPAAAQPEDGPKPPSTDQELSDEQQKKFDKLVKTGKRHFAQNNYEQALERFEKAYEIKRSSNLLFNMGLVAEKSGDLETALDYYKTFVVSPNVSLDLRDKAQKRIKVIEPIVEDQLEDKKKAEQRAEEEPESLAETEGTKGDSGDSTSDTDTGETAEGGGSGVGGLLLTGGGVAAIGGGVAFTLLSQQAKNTFETASSVDKRRSAQQSAYVNQWIGSGLLVAGVGAATGGIVMLLSQQNGKADSSSKAALRPTVGPNFTGVQFRTNF